MALNQISEFYFKVTHLGLTEHLETVLTDELQQLAVSKAEEFLFFGHLQKRCSIWISFNLLFNFKNDFHSCESTGMRQREKLKS